MHACEGKVAAKCGVFSVPKQQTCSFASRPTDSEARVGGARPRQPRDEEACNEIARCVAARLANREGFALFGFREEQVARRLVFNLCWVKLSHTDFNLIATFKSSFEQGDCQWL